MREYSSNCPGRLPREVRGRVNQKRRDQWERTRAKGVVRFVLTGGILWQLASSRLLKKAMTHEYSRAIPPTQRECENPNRQVGDASVQPTGESAAVPQFPNRQVGDPSRQPSEIKGGQRLERSPTCRLGDLRTSCPSPVGWIERTPTCRLGDTRDFFTQSLRWWDCARILVCYRLFQQPASVLPERPG